MADMSPGTRRAMQYWGVIEHAARERMNTADLWAAIRDQAAAAGLDRPGVTAQDVSRLRGIAGSIRGADRQLDRANAEYGLTGAMISRAPWARDFAAMNTSPMHQVRFEHQFTREGEPVTEWRSVMFQGALPTTVAELMAALDFDAQQMADNYGYEHVGIGAVSILAV